MELVSGEIVQDLAHYLRQSTRSLRSLLFYHSVRDRCSIGRRPYSELMPGYDPELIDKLESIQAMASSHLLEQGAKAEDLVSDYL